MRGVLILGLIIASAQVMPPEGGAHHTLVTPTGAAGEAEGPVRQIHLAHELAPRPSPLAPPHDYHVSITHIDHNPKTQSLEITTKIFTEDLEKTITTHGGPVLKLGDPKEDPRADPL